jgi:hypothetical protein
VKKRIYLILMISLFICCGPKEGKVEKVIIDGVAHIMNPEKPLKGTVQLDIEKTRELNPYLHEDVGLRNFSFVRDIDGEVILFDYKAEAQRFNRNGEYMGRLFREGQGPGEFPPRRMFNACFMNGQIWATGDMKFAKYDKDGQFLYEQRIDYRPDIFVDENAFFIMERDRDEEGSVSRVTLVNLSQDREKESTEVDFYKERNVGYIQRKDGDGFTDDWGVPDLEYAYDPENEKIYGGLNTSYKIYVKNLKGEILYVIEKPYKHVGVSMADKKELLPWAAEDISQKWALSAYPDTLVAVKDMKILPKGYLAVYRVSGVQTYEVDVFDPEGKFVYIVKPPEGISLDDVKFYDFGFATRETQEDEFLVYTEYTIKNLPDIFDPEGRYLAKIPLKMKSLFWKKSKLYAIEGDEEGFQSVKRYKVTWKY